MQWLSRYVASVTFSALICSIMQGLMKQSSLKGVLRLVCGIFLTICVLLPLTTISDWSLEGWTIPELEAGEGLVFQGSQNAKTSLERIITQETEAYILDIAKELGLEILVSVELSKDEPPLPVGVNITGSAAPYQKLCLEDRIFQELNIPKENQRWIG